MDYYDRYFKYKQKYISLKNLIGGDFSIMDRNGLCLEEKMLYHIFSKIIQILGDVE